MTALPAREAYRLWAPRYAAETVVSVLETAAVAELGVPTAGVRLLDVGCGTGRRLRGTDAALAVGVDLALEMLLAGRDNSGDSGDIAAGDACALPFAAQSFDVVWCRLVIGHLRDVAACYAELGRVCADGGTVIVSDIAPEAAAAGHRRTFRDALGTVREVEHFVHSLEAHASAAREAGLELEASRDGVVGPRVRPFYARAERVTAYDAQRGLSLVRALAWRKRTGQQ